MRLLFRSTFRHMRQHYLQTILTLAVTVLVMATMSVLFHCASGFQRVLRQYALEQVGKMDCWELLFHMAGAFIPGFIAGMLCYQRIYAIYCTGFQVTWRFPWDGLLSGMLVLCLSEALAELTRRASLRKLTIADMLRM